MVIIAEERAARPHQFDIEPYNIQDENAADYRPTCPFCEGNEGQTTKEITAFRKAGTLPDSPGWLVRAIPNKYPAVVQDTVQDTVQNAAVPADWAAVGLQDGVLENSNAYRMPGLGRHEVIVDTPRHILSVTDMTAQEIQDMFRMYRERLSALKSEGRWACVEIFKNVGAAAGASIPHSHSQLIALPFVPAAFHASLRRAEHDQRQGRCIWCEMLQLELREKRRIVEETEHFVALCPFASRFAAEVEIYPKRHCSGFEEMENHEVLAEFSNLVQRTVARLEHAVTWISGRLAYNFILHTQPFILESLASNNVPLFHWHLSILPSLARAAGFEWGTGLHINPISPEKAAEQLRGS